MNPEVALNEFLRQVADDRAKGKLKTLTEYQERWPRFAHLIADEHARVSRPPDLRLDVDREKLPEAWRRIGPYATGRLLGRGGQGVVLSATDPDTGDQVAIKLLTGLSTLSSMARERLRREALLLSRLDHPGLCAVRDSGEHEGMPYLVLDLIEGTPLSRLIRSRHASDAETAITEPPSQETMLRLVIGIARALEVAHGGGIVHRDVKPANVMVRADGTPVLLDFGLARAEEGDGSPTLTRTGDVFGTPAYMSPEQITAGEAAVSPRSDVYSLGATLYECLTGRLPFEQPTPEAQFHAIRTSPAPDPRRIVPSVPRDLAAIVATTLEKRPDRRYASAAAFADDLERHLDGEPIHARLPGATMRAISWARRHPAVALLGAALLVTILSAGAWAAHALQLLDGRRAVAEARGESLRRQAYRSDVAAALARIQLGDVRGGRRLLDATNPDLRGWEWRHGSWLADRSQTHLQAHDGKGYAVPLDSANGDLLTYGEDGSRRERTVRIWNRTSGQLVHEVADIPTGAVLASPSGRAALFIDAEDSARPRIAAWSLQPPQERWSLVIEAVQLTQRSPSWSPDESTIAVGVPMALLLLNAETGEARRLPVPGHVIGPDYLDSDRIVSRLRVGDEVRGVVLHARSGAILSEIEAPHEDARISGIRALPGGRRALVSWRRDDRGAATEGAAAPRQALHVVLDLIDGREVARTTHTAISRAWIDSRGLFAMGKLNGSVELVDPDGDRVVATLRGHSDPVRRIHVLEESERLLTSTAFGEVRSWSSNVGAAPFVSSPFGSRVSATAPDGSAVVAGTWGMVTSFDTADGAPRWRSNLGRAGIDALAFDPTGEHLACGDGLGLVVQLDARTGKEIGRARVPDAVTALTYAEDGQTIVIGQRSGAIALWRHADAGVEPCARLPVGPVVDLLCLDGGRTAWAITQGETHRVDLEARKVSRLDAVGPVTALLAGPRPDTVLTADRARRIVIRAGADGTALETLAHMTSPVTVMAWIDGGRRLAVGARRSVHLVEADSGQPVFDHACAELFLHGIGYREDSGTLLLTGRRMPFQALETRAPPASEARREHVRQAMTRIRELQAQLGLSRSVREELMADPTLSSVVRDTAIELTAALGDSANQLNARAWTIVSGRGGSPAALAMGLAFAERASQLMPGDHAIVNTLGVAQLRAGHFAEAVETMSECIAMPGFTQSSYRAVDHAVRAMALAGLGALDRARTDLETAEAIASAVGGLLATEARAFLDEARETLRSLEDD